VIAPFIQAPDYAKVRLHWNGHALGAVFDAYVPTVTLSGEIKLATLDLTAGEGRLEIKIVGAHE
jgi:hypothetical protein